MKPPFIDEEEVKITNKNFSSLLLFLTVFLAASYSVAQGSADGDRAALLKLYNATGGADWTVSTNWNDPTSLPGTWQGVSTDPDNRVIHLNLDNNQLIGTITDLSALTKLEHLYLDNNQLSGPIPDLSALTKLEHLYLDNNQLSGPIPDLSALTKLETLSLENNQLSGPIPEMLRFFTVNIEIAFTLGTAGGGSS